MSSPGLRIVEAAALLSGGKEKVPHSCGGASGRTECGKRTEDSGRSPHCEPFPHSSMDEGAKKVIRLAKEQKEKK